jgi:hypothetical protein
LRTIALIGIPSDLCNLRISAQVSTVITPHDRGGLRFQPSPGVSFHPSTTGATVENHVSPFEHRADEPNAGMATLVA